MKKYTLTSPKFDGQILFGYNDSRVLVYFNNETTMTFDQHAWVLKKLPLGEDEIDPLSKKINGVLAEVPEDISFDRFWDDYGKKINLKRCKPLWAKLTEGEAMTAILRIPAYKAYLKRTNFRNTADPEKYLRDRYFETDWNKER